VDLLLPGTLAELERGGSEVRLELVELEVRESDRALRDGRVDLCFVPRSALGDGIESEELLRDPWIAVVPEVHRLAGRETAHLADLAGETVIVLERDDDWRDASRAVIAQLGSAVRPGLRASGPSVALCLVRAGMGICVLPATAINAFVPGLRVIVLEDTGMHWMLARLPGSVSQASLTVSDGARRAARRIPHDCGISSVLRALADR
jgi:DNA-binding transcriptional LysR family regulator